MRKYGVLQIKLATPILFPSNRPWEGIKLDGLLGWIWAKDHGLTKTPAENNPENIVFPELPLVQIAPKLYGASTMFVPVMDELWETEADSLRPSLVSCYPEVIVKSSNWQTSMRKQVRLGLKDFKPNISSGAYRGAMEPYWALQTPYIYFYWATDDFDALIDYFDRIPKECFGIGAKTRIGYGRITEVVYNETEEAECFYYKDNAGRPTRPIPVDGPFNGKFPDSCTGVSSWRAPYFSASTKALCYLPPVEQYLPQPISESPILDNLLDSVAKDQQNRHAAYMEKQTKRKGSKKK